MAAAVPRRSRGRRARRALHFTASGKRSLTLDAAKPDGAAILRRLLELADVLIDDRGVSAQARPFRVGRGSVEPTNPRLVRLAFRNFTAGGPYEKWLATELQLAALGGWMAQLGEPRRTPLISNSRTMTAFVPGVIGAITALAAVRGARLSGCGRRIDVAAQEALVFTTRFNETFLSYTGIELSARATVTPAGPPTARLRPPTETLPRPPPPTRRSKN